MGRGENSSHRLLTGEQPKQSKKELPGRGRSAELLKIRNEALFYRYYYYNKVHKKRYNDVLQLLCVEFFLRDRTISMAVIRNLDRCKAIFNEALTVPQLAKKYPYLKWQSPEPAADKRKTIIVD